MKVFVCSQYSGDVEENVKRTIRYCRNEIFNGNAPYAPHLYLPLALDDSNLLERAKGINCGMEFLAACDSIHVYVVSGHISEGMRAEIKYAQKLKKPIRWFSGIDLWELEWTPTV